jgi:dihydrolipoamide dehydrogenase
MVYATLKVQKKTGKHRFDRVLVSTGRIPNGSRIGADIASQVTDRGFIPVDKQMRTNVPHIFANGDIVGQPMQRLATQSQGCSRSLCRDRKLL